jgi:hypothetical protein
MVTQCRESHPMGSRPRGKDGDGELTDLLAALSLRPGRTMLDGVHMHGHLWPRYPPGRWRLLTG